MAAERRVSATPETVALMVKNGLTVWVERSAGEGSYYHDDQYTEAGAVLKANARSIYSKADVIVKVKEPQFNNELQKHEIDMMLGGQHLIAFLHPASPANHQMVRDLATKHITALTLDGVPRITRAQKMDALTSMSSCAGYKGMLMAADIFPRFIQQIFTAVGMIKPITALVIGAGVAGLQAMATAKRLGAVIYAADIRPEAEEQIKSLGARVAETGVPAEAAVGEGGYALSLSKEWLEKEQAALKQRVIESDIVICSALVPNRKAPILITEEMVKAMKPGSVLVDISIDQGGNCALTEAGEVVTRHGVTIIGIKNLPGMIPASSTWMFSQNVYHLLEYLIKDGEIKLDRNDEIIKGILTTYGGKIVHAGALEAMA
jgi:NAD(P) transhydrogenase subunit alpha